MTKIPVIGEETPTPTVPAKETPSPTPAVTKEPAYGNGAGNSTGSGRNIRNYELYPVFSSFFPSRRLNLPADPEAHAHIPGLKIWPEPESSSPLNRMLGN